ncbi:helix-turn-helix domain-containing protein [Celerinatantimonas sp. YJH-8]|uniref:helix-turn-helix domain-containing protein n=1 Tax=Celerinatantimonas sp. YJH-8 TaxID=3228714 RepID=UPI0038C07E83
MTPEETRLKQHIATHLKNLRSQRKLSLDAVARLTGVSKAMLGQIEREESSPTIAKLWQIASGLDTSFSAFLSEKTTEMAAREQAFADDPNMQMRTLTAYDPTVKFEIFDIQLLHHHIQQSEAHAHGVIETVWVLEGQLDIFCDNQWHPLQSNDTFRFYADQTHIYKAVSERVRFQNIVNYT